MWQQLSLRTRLNLLFALVLVVGLAANIGRLVLEAGPRIQAEDDSVLRLAREFVDASISDLKGSADPEAKLTTIVDGLQKLRHVSVTHERAGERIVAAPGDAALGKGRFDAPPEDGVVDPYHRVWGYPVVPAVFIAEFQAMLAM